MFDTAYSGSLHSQQHARRTQALGVLNILLVDPSITFFATDKVIGNLALE